MRNRYDIHRGWYIWQDAQGWRATQYGVTVRANTRENLVAVINHHIQDREAWFKRLAKIDASEEAI